MYRPVGKIPSLLRQLLFQVLVGTRRYLFLIDAQGVRSTSVANAVETQHASDLHDIFGLRTRDLLESETDDR